MPTSRLAAFLGWDAIVDLAGSLYLQRGMGYLEDGRVGPIRATDDAIEATVHGERSYDRATRIRGILPYGEVAAFVRGVDDTADMLDRLVRDGRPAVAIDLAERALRRLEQALELADDSDGLIGDLLDRFQTLHLDACHAARPDPIKLAERLFRWELTGDWEVFRGAAQRYADVLGEAGLATYRRLAEAEWARIPALGPGDQDTTDEDDDRFNLTCMMESLARASQDVDMEIAVLSRDLSSAYGFLQIAQLCRDAGRGDEALDWAERGARAFPSRTDVRIREFLADEYLRRSRAVEAMTLIWAEYSEGPALERFKLLKKYADRIEAWAAWRLRALDELRRSIEQAMAAEPARAQPARFRWQQPADGSRLVDILLWEGNVDDAWHEARRLGCRRDTWLDLARRSEEARPEDALAVYRQEVADLFRVTDKRVYAEVVDLLRRIRALMSRLGTEADFTAYATGVRVANARRPAFLALFDAARLIERQPDLRVVKGADPS